MEKSSMGNDNDIKVSVIMPVYNAERYLSDTLRSICEQTLKEIEIICVDDGSTDSSPQILKEFEKEDKRISVLRQRNSYAGVARNNGIDRARGKYLSFLDADDLFDADMLKKAYLRGEEERADVVVFGGKYFNNDVSDGYTVGGLLREEILPEGNGFCCEELRDVILHFTIGCPWNKLFLREHIENNKIRFSTYKRVNDVFFVQIALAKAKKIGIVREPLISYRVNNSGGLQNTKKENPLLFVDAFRDSRNELISARLYDKVKVSFDNILLAECINTLEQMGETTEYETVYNEIRSSIINEFELDYLTEEMVYRKSDYKYFKEVMNLSCAEFWMQKYKRDNNHKKRFLFPFGDIKRDADIVIYAAGVVGKEYLKQILLTKYVHEVVIVDKNPNINSIAGVKVSRPDEISWDEFAYIIIAVEKKTIADDIRMNLVKELGCDDKKIVWNVISI